MRGVLYREVVTAISVTALGDDIEEVETTMGRALNYVDLTGSVHVGDKLLVNRTAKVLGLGTGGYDFVMARLEGAEDADRVSPGHIIKARYTPVQHAVHALEEMPEHKAVWDRRVDGFPAMVGQLHSQLAPIAAALALRGARLAYVQTDAAALPVAFSRLVRDLRSLGWLTGTITAGQAFGGDYETVTVASAIIAAKHILGCDAVAIIQGPGNAGTATKYGFGGFEQAAHLNTAGALGGHPIAVVRMSSADARERHLGVSHHTRTSLDATFAECDVPVPEGSYFGQLPSRHSVHEITGVRVAIEHLAKSGINVTSMGRGLAQDPLFFEAAAAAGLHAADLILRN